MGRRPVTIRRIEGVEMVVTAAQKTLYEVLGVSRNAKANEIGLAYQRLRAAMQDETSAPDARRAAMAKMGFAVVRQMPTTAHGGFRPVTPLGKPVAAPRPKMAAKGAKAGGVKNGAKVSGKSRVLVAARTRVAAASRVATTPRIATPTRIVLPVRPVAQARTAAPAKTAARPKAKPALRAHGKPAKKKGTSRH